MREQLRQLGAIDDAVAIGVEARKPRLHRPPRRRVRRLAAPLERRRPPLRLLALRRVALGDAVVPPVHFRHFLGAGGADAAAGDDAGEAGHCVAAGVR